MNVDVGFDIPVIDGNWDTFLVKFVVSPAMFISFNVISSSVIVVRVRLFPSSVNVIVAVDSVVSLITIISGLYVIMLPFITLAHSLYEPSVVSDVVVGIVSVYPVASLHCVSISVTAYSIVLFVSLLVGAEIMLPDNVDSVLFM